MEYEQISEDIGKVWEKLYSKTILFNGSFGKKIEKLRGKYERNIVMYINRIPQLNFGR